jgi:hypothetical protein
MNQILVTFDDSMSEEEMKDTAVWLESTSPAVVVAEIVKGHCGKCAAPKNVDEARETNSRYATAQYVFDEWKEAFDTSEGEKCGFQEWLKLRLNS